MYDKALWPVSILKAAFSFSLTKKRQVSTNSISLLYQEHCLFNCQQPNLPSSKHLNRHHYITQDTSWSRCNYLLHRVGLILPWFREVVIIFHRTGCFARRNPDPGTKIFMASPGGVGTQVVFSLPQPRKWRGLPEVFRKVSYSRNTI